MWIKRKVQHGTKTGRTIGFPTINLNVGDFGYNHSDGVYACQVKIDNQIYKGGLFFGQRMHDKKQSLEIYIIGFNQQIYDRFIAFKILQRIRQPKQFDDLNKLKKQIAEDIKGIE